ncbi:MAG: hypothetical protein O7C56_04885 [Rickettsia endosymbiont of Ixodes persulcatus]|nr:hypothetical protein [Rickettsia endosymbiont of Ixodes persulcatus]
MLSAKKIHEEETNLKTMQQRAILAYEYLYDNHSDHAIQLKKRLDIILSDDLSMTHQDEISWSKKATHAFEHYYRKKNPLLWKETRLARELNLSGSRYAVFNEIKANAIENKNEQKNHTPSTSCLRS